MGINKLNITVLLFFFLASSSYFSYYVLTFATESLILFFAFSCLILYVLSNEKIAYKHDNSEVRLQELIKFYVILRNWHRMYIIHVDVRMLQFLCLSIELKKYVIKWYARNIKFLKQKEWNLLCELQKQRLQYLSTEYQKKYNTSTNSVLNLLPIHTFR